MLKRRLFLSGIAATCTARAAVGRRFDVESVQMATRFRLSLYAADAAQAEKAANDVFARLSALTAIFSDYEPESELSRRMADRGSQLLLNGPAPLAARLRQEIPQWREVVAAAGIQPE